MAKSPPEGDAPDAVRKVLDGILRSLGIRVVPLDDL
jgi:hypothetical protein